ncbi:hypothetical protein Trydic_g401 [Trypoxylus dichotomus]
MEMAQHLARQEVVKWTNQILKRRSRLHKRREDYLADDIREKAGKNWTGQLNAEEDEEEGWAVKPNAILILPTSTYVHTLRDTVNI